MSNIKITSLNLMQYLFDHVFTINLLKKIILVANHIIPWPRNRLKQFSIATLYNIFECNPY